MPSIDSDIVVNIEDQNFYHYEENGHKSFVDHKAEYPWPVMPDVYSTDYFDDKCAICKSPLSVSRANLVIRDTDGDYEGTFVQFVHWCPNCRKYYFTDEDNTRIANEFLRMKQGQILIDVDKEDAEAGDSIIHHDRGYLDLPVLETDIRIDLSKHNLNIVSNKTIDALKELKETLETLEDMREKYGIVSQIGDLKDQSFLGMMGYSTGESFESRHRILEKAVRIHGKRRVIDHLQYLINTRSGSVERDYSNAIRIWKSDIEYVIACE